MTGVEVAAEHVHPQGTVRERAETDDPLDLRRLLEEWKDHTPVLWKLLETFRRESASDLADLETALNSSDATRVAHLAHRIKGSAAVMGAQRVRELAAMLEAYAKRRDLNSALPCLRTLRTELDRCSGFLDALQRNRQPA